MNDPSIERQAAETAVPAAPSRSVDQFVGAELADHERQLRSMLHDANHRIEIDSIVHIQTNSLVGGEALARFPGSTSPATWFQLANALGLGADLELAMLDAVLAESTSITHGFIGVNVSPAVLVDPECVDRLRDSEDDRLVVEITEQTSVPELGLLLMHIDQVRDAGVRIATHVAAFNADALRSLRRLNPDIVKLNPPLTAALAAGKTETAATDEFLAQCRYDGAFVVAVGVERNDQLEVLERRNVDAYQGHLARESHPNAW